MPGKGKAFPFHGTWIAKDDRATDVEIKIAKRGPKVVVKARDSSDGEIAEIYDVKSSANELRFCALWSTGQFTKYRLRSFGIDEIEVNFTFTGTDFYRRR